MSASLLPPNASATERALDLATARIGDVPVAVDALWNPTTCPVALLPWLAWAFSVDEWDAGWSEAQKRRAIGRSFFVHQHKGTVAALKAALSAVDYSIALVEWFQDAGDLAPYQFRADVTITGRGIDAATQDQILRIVMATKNVRSELKSLRFIGRVEGALHVASTTLSGEITRVEPYSLTEASVTGHLCGAAALVARDRTAIYPGA